MSQVSFHRIALFGKGAANQDYDWLEGRSAVPASFFDACQFLARISSETATSFSALALLPEGTYLARSFHQGFDTAYRPSLALEVVRLRSPEPLEAEHLLAIAWFAIQKSWDETTEGRGENRIDIPELRDERVEPDQELRLRARLGLPASAPDIWQGLALLRAFPQRYAGIAFAPQLRKGALPWDRSLALLLAIRFEPPSLEAEDSELLAAVAHRPPTAEEWRILDRLATPELRQILLWSVSPEGQFPGLPRGGSAAWLVAYRGREMRGVPLLARLRSDLGLAALPPDLLVQAFPDLSPEAQGVLAASEAGDSGGSVSPDTLAELAEAGLLAEGSPIPPRTWLSAAAQSEAVARAGVDLLRRRGVDEAPARWLLGCLPENHPLDVSQVLLAVLAAGELQMEIPLSTLRSLLTRARFLADLEALEETAEELGPQGAALLRLVTRAVLPSPGILEEEDFLLGLVVRQRFAQSVDLPAVLQELLAQGRELEARSVLAAAQRGEISCPYPAALGALAARLAGEPPVEVGDREAEGLSWLARAGLISPEHVIPRAKGRIFRDVAAVWPKTAPLAAVLRAERGVPPPGSCPAGWKAALRKVLEPDPIRRWLDRWSGDDLEAPRLWLCEALDLPTLARDGAVGIRNAGADGATELLACHAWLVLLWQAAPVDRRLEILAALAARDWLVGEYRRAAELVRQMLGEDSPAQDLCTHLLSRVGPLPPIYGIGPDHLAILTPAAEPAALIDQLFCFARRIDQTRLIDAVVARAQQTGVPYPKAGYNPEQIELHLPLASRLSSLPGWKPLAPDPQTRSRFARRLLEELGLACPPGWEAEERKDRDVTD